MPEISFIACEMIVRPSGRILVDIKFEWEAGHCLLSKSINGEAGFQFVDVRI